MDILRGLFGIISILGIAFLMSNNRKAINYRLVGSGLGLQLTLALFILKTSIGQKIFKGIGNAITGTIDAYKAGTGFVFGPLANEEIMTGKGMWVPFFIILTGSIIFVCVLVAILYQLGVMQRIVAVLAKGMHAIMRASGSETLSNVASAFVGQVEAQIMIKPYLAGMTKSELLASMAGSMACISGGVMVIYMNTFHIPAPELLAASLMAAPGALVIAKIVYPETEVSQTQGEVKLAVEKPYANMIDAISHACSDGLKISLNVIAMLIGFLALIKMVDLGLGLINPTLTLAKILGYVFAGFAFLMGIDTNEILRAGEFLGTKFVANEFIAYDNFSKVMTTFSPKTVTILTIALCGFANLGSVGIQIGGIGELAPSRRLELTQLGFKALICGTLASYLSATIAGMLQF
ncbi:MAG: NupC/NupG family nucleoside CNT transporter [Bacteroidia bacterium]